MIDRQHVAHFRPSGLSIASCVSLFGFAALCLVPFSALGGEGAWRNLFPFGSGETTQDDDHPDADLLMSDPIAPDPTEETMLEEDQSRDWMVTSPFGNVTWPEIRMPKFEFNPPWRTAPEGKEGWLTAPFAKVRNASQGAIARTRAGWNYTLDRMKFAMPGGRDDDVGTPAQLADGTTHPGFWQRMLGPKDIATDSDDVVELMAREPGGTQR